MSQVVANCVDASTRTVCGGVPTLSEKDDQVPSLPRLRRLSSAPTYMTYGWLSEWLNRKPGVQFATWLYSDRCGWHYGNGLIILAKGRSYRGVKIKYVNMEKSEFFQDQAKDILRLRTATVILSHQVEGGSLLAMIVVRTYNKADKDRGTMEGPGTTLSAFSISRSPEHVRVCAVCCTSKSRPGLQQQ